MSHMIQQNLPWWKKKSIEFIEFIEFMSGLETREQRLETRERGILCSQLKH